MKKLTLIISLVFFTIITISQIPQAFKYQTLVRNNIGEIVANQNVSFQISILETNATGPSVYTERHNTATNEFGLANLEIGKGNIVSGIFESIDWGNDSYYLQIELDASGGTNYQLMGTSQLLSVPYALHSGTTSDTSTWKKEVDDIYYKNGKVGIGTDSPTQLLSTNGIIESMTEGFMFPDGTVQTTAAESSSGGNSDSIVFGGPPTAAEVRGFIGMLVDGVAGSWEWGLDCEDCSAVFDMEWSIYRPFDGNVFTGPRQHNMLTIYKNIDRASVPLLQRVVNSTVIPDILFKFYRFNESISNYEIYYTITLEDVSIVEFHHDVYHIGYGNMAHMDKISFVYATITWEWLDGALQYQDNWSWPE